ncbi:MAG: capsid cement protein [Blastocatellia bacterium]
MPPTQGYVFDDNCIAAASLATKQGFAVKITAANKNVNLCAAVTDIGYGILMNKPASGAGALVRVLGNAEAVSDGSGTAISVGDKVGPDANGRLVKVTTVDRPVMGTALDASSALGTLIRVNLTPNAVYRTPA